MEYLVMECGLSYAVVLDQDGRILKVPNLGYTVGQSLKDVVLLPERPVRQQVLHKRMWYCCRNGWQSRHFTSALPAGVRWQPACACSCWEAGSGSRPSERCECTLTPMYC